MSRGSYPITRPSYGSYEWFQRELGIAVGIGANFHQWDHPEVEKVDTLIQRGVQRFYQTAVTGQRFQRSHRWSFLYPQTSMTLSASYGTGTVEIINGVATITGGTFPTWVLDGEFQVLGTAAEIDAALVGAGISVTAVSGLYDELTLSDTSINVAAGTPYLITRPTYSLPSTFGSLDGPLTYRAGTGGGCAIPVVPEHYLREQRSPLVSTGYPQVAAIYPQTPDASNGTLWQITFHPSPDAAYQLYYRYRIKMTDLLPGEFPLGGTENAETILASCMALLNPQMEERFIAMVAAAVDADQTNHSADSIGQNRDRSDGTTMNRQYGVDDLTPYNGVFYT